MDGLAGGEGAFLICSFWLVSALATAGRVEEAERNLAALRNDVGLLSEEYDPQSKRLLGNFPQAFSHRTVARHLRDQRSTPVGHIRPPARPADGSRGVPRLGRRCGSGEVQPGIGLAAATRDGCGRQSCTNERSSGWLRKTL